MQFDWPKTDVMQRFEVEQQLLVDGFFVERRSQGNTVYSNPDGRRVHLPQNVREVKNHLLREIYKQARWTIHSDSVRKPVAFNPVLKEASKTCADRPPKKVATMSGPAQLSESAKKSPVSQRTDPEVQATEEVKPEPTMTSDQRLQIAVTAEQHGAVEASKRLGIERHLVIECCREFNIAIPSPALKRPFKRTRRPQLTKKIVAEIAGLLLKSPDRHIMRQVAEEFDLHRQTMTKIANGDHTMLAPPTAVKIKRWWASTKRCNMRPPDKGIHVLQKDKSVQQKTVQAPIAMPQYEQRTHDILLMLVEVCVRMYGADENFLRRYLRTTANIELPEIRKPVFAAS
jgi:predicted RNA binding protein YcfA (HicA-like mRNA interferase family)